jgi:hypothetical protein
MSSFGLGEKIEKSLDIDSTYRNRGVYPSQFNFVVPIVNSSGGNVTIDAIPYSASSSDTNLVLAGSTTTSINLSLSETNIDNYYINSYLQINGESRLITYYDGTTHKATVSPAFTLAPPLNSIYVIRKALPVTEGSIDNSTPSTTTTVYATLPNLNYTGLYIRFTSGLNTGAIQKIESYTIGTPSSLTLETPLPDTPTGGDSFEILAASRVNSGVLLSSGGSVQTNQTSYYEIGIDWISIPYKTIQTSYGGRLDNYPYIYVQLYNDGKRLYNQALISNNPNSPLALFKIPIDEYYGATSFLLLKNCNTRQIVRFDTTTDIRFVVTLPDGTIPEFMDSDSPVFENPDPLLQVNALFRIKRLDN